MHAYSRITAAGFAATAITYGPARMGFGLFLSDFRAEFGFSAGTAGLISSLGFAGLLLALPAAYVLAARVSPRVPVLIGLASAGLGAGLIAAAQGPVMLAAGAVLALSSAGFSWAPFNAAVTHHLSHARRPTALSIISTGTTLGVAAAGLAALWTSAGGLSWRPAWAGFSVGALIAAAAAALLLAGVSAGRRAPAGAPRRMLARRAVPLHGLAFVFGAASTVYLSFAADGVAQQGGLEAAPGLAPALIFIAYGIAGLSGLATGAVGRVLGLERLLRLVFAACGGSFALIALAPGSLAAVLGSAALQGGFVMMASALFAFWSERLFPALPSMSFTVALLAVAAGSVLGPLAAGYAVDALGFAAMAGTACGVTLIIAAAIPSRLPVEDAAPAPA